MIHRAIRTCAVMLLLWLLDPAARVQAQGFDHAGLARQVLERHVRPSYEALAHAAQSFELATSEFCEARPGIPVGPVRQTFRELVFAWERISHIRFGPVMDEQRHHRILYWPDRKGLGRRQIAGALRNRDQSVTETGSLAGKSVALQGLGALEYLLYGPGAALLHKDGEARGHRCGYLTAAGKNFANVANDIVAGWDGEEGFTKVFLEPGTQNPRYLKQPEVTLEIAKAFLVGMELLRDIRIAGPLGLQRGKGRRTRAAFETSRLSTEAIAANLEGLVHLFNGGGLRERIEAYESGMGEAINNDLAISLEGLKGVKLPMKEVAEDPDVEVELIAIGFPLKNAREQTARVLAQAAGLSLGFNALDGD